MLLLLAAVLVAPPPPLRAGGSPTQQPAAPSPSPAASPSPTSPGRNGPAIPLTLSRQPPWRRAENRTARRPLNPPSSPRQLLINIDQNELDSFFEDPALDPDSPTLLKILYRLPRFGLDNIERLANKTTGMAWEEVIHEARRHRAKMFRLAGRVQRIERHDLDPQAAELCEFDHYYRAAFAVSGCPSPVTVIARKLPQAWPRGAALDERSSCFGLFLKVGSPAGPGGRRPLIFAAARIAWHPDRQRPAAHIGASHVLLGELGMDVGLFDDVRQRNGKGVDSAADSECFYQLLAAVGRADPQELARRCRRPLELAPLLLKPKTQHGKLFAVRGSARRITEIRIDQPYYRKRLGIDHYYQIDVLVPLEDQQIRLSRAQGDPSGPVFTNNFPVTVCVLRLPEGLAPSENMNQEVRIPSFHFKLWSYHSELVRRYGKDQRQISPMLVGLEPQLIRYQRTANPYANAIVLSIVVLALGGIWIGLWWSSRGDKRFRRELLRRQLEIKEGKSLDELGTAREDEPDFSGLE